MQVIYFKNTMVLYKIAVIENF